MGNHDESSYEARCGGGPRERAAATARATDRVCGVEGRAVPRAPSGAAPAAGCRRRPGTGAACGRDGEGREAGAALLVVSVDVRRPVVVVMRRQRARMHVGRRPVGVVVDDERRLRDEPAGEEARQNRQRRGAGSASSTVRS